MGATVSTTKKVIIKRPPKTIKEKAFVREYMANGGNGVQAIKATYNPKNTNVANHLAYKNLQKLDISAIFDKAGLSDDAIAQTLRDAIGATNRMGQPDWLPRLKSAEMALKVKGHFKERIEHSGAVGVYPILGGASKGAAATGTIDSIGAGGEGVEVSDEKGIVE